MSYEVPTSVFFGKTKAGLETVKYRLLASDAETVIATWTTSDIVDRGNGEYAAIATFPDNTTAGYVEWSTGEASPRTVLDDVTPSLMGVALFKTLGSLASQADVSLLQNLLEQLLSRQGGDIGTTTEIIGTTEIDQPEWVTTQITFQSPMTMTKSGDLSANINALVMEPNNYPIHARHVRIDWTVIHRRNGSIIDTRTFAYDRLAKTADGHEIKDDVIFIATVRAGDTIEIKWKTQGYVDNGYRDGWLYSGTVDWVLTSINEEEAGGGGASGGGSSGSASNIQLEWGKPDQEFAFQVRNVFGTPIVGAAVGTLKLSTWKPGDTGFGNDTYDHLRELGGGWYVASLPPEKLDVEGHHLLRVKQGNIPVAYVEFNVLPPQEIEPPIPPRPMPADGGF